jgi:hypothetical protein
MATHMERIGVEPHVIEVCFGHTLKSVAGTYRQYGYLPEKACALQARADELLPAYHSGPGARPGGGRPLRRTNGADPERVASRVAARRVLTIA